MRTTLVCFALTLLAFACTPAESPDPLEEMSVPASENAEAPITANAVGVRHVRVLERIAAQDLRRTSASHVVELDEGRSVGLRAQACLDNCGGAPWCAAMCETFENLNGDPAFPEEAQRPAADCPACGRETGFLPAPPTVEARREGQVVEVRWSEVTDAEQYELVVLRQKGNFGNYEVFGDQTTVDREAHVSMLPVGFVYVFAVTPYLQGELAVQVTGYSAPLSL